MKSKEELAQKWVETAMGRGGYSGFLAGFDAGFQRAVDLLRSNEATAARWAENMRAIVNDGKIGVAAEFYANWLEKQSPETHQSGGPNDPG